MERRKAGCALTGRQPPMMGLILRLIIPLDVQTVIGFFSSKQPEQQQPGHHIVPAVSLCPRPRLNS